MKRSTFKVLFYLKRQSEKTVKPRLWGALPSTARYRSSVANSPYPLNLRDTEGNKAAGKSIEARQINEKLDNIRTNIGKQYQRICDRDSAALPPKRSKTHG